MQPADYSNAAHDARERRCANTTQGRTVPCCPSRSLLLTLSLAPSRSPSPLVPNRIESHGIKPSPGAFPPLYAVAESGERFLRRSVWTGPFIPPNFQPRRVYGRSTSSQPSFTRRSRRHRLPPPRVGSRPPLGADTPASTTERPGAPGFLNILFTRRLLLPLRLLELRCLSLCLIITRVSFSRTASAAALV